ncbi:MAG TPA: protein kinase [Pyrinomonadaceae bacterium]
MTPERWQQISRIFKSAISLDGEARHVYVAEQCGADDSLRSEVEKLIASHKQASAEEFIGGRAAEKGAVLIIDPDEDDAARGRLNEGQQLGSYVVLKRLGAGGMGEVYLARDSRLDRTVALKVLSADVSSDKRRMQRFRQEARVASTLNQPNILTIFEFGEVDGLTFLATEFIDGETLRDYLHGKQLKLPEVLDIAIQILAALDAAHEARIVHRDIKPENVMIRRRDHVVKVLDFGLAKVTEKKSAIATHRESDLEAATEMKTAPGMLMGTINYMSPEQAQAQTVDERSDIWSTGVMLYEMVTGVMPFSGPTTGHTLVQIIDKEPPPLPKAAAAPAELQRIILKAMAKSAEDRYQTAKDMLIDLRNLRKQLDAGPSTTDDTDLGAKKKRVLVIALVAIAVVTAAIFAVNIWRAQSARSAAVVSTVPMSTPVPVPVSNPQRTLTYWITVQQVRDGEQKTYTVRGEINFEHNDQIRLNLRSPQAGCLYVFNEGPRGGSATPEFNIAFPTPTANNGSSRLNAGQEIRIPDQSWLYFDTQQGIERLWLIFAEDALPELEALKRFASPKTGGLITDPEQNKLVENFLLSHSSSKPEVERGDTLTTVKMPGKVLLHPLMLEHH